MTDCHIECHTYYTHGPSSPNTLPYPKHGRMRPFWNGGTFFSIIYKPFRRILPKYLYGFYTTLSCLNILGALCPRPPLYTTLTQPLSCLQCFHFSQSPDTRRLNGRRNRTLLSTLQDFGDVSMRTVNPRKEGQLTFYFISLWKFKLKYPIWKYF